MDIEGRAGVRKWTIYVSLMFAVFLDTVSARYYSGYPSRVSSDHCPQLPVYDRLQCSRSLFALCESDWSCSSYGKVCCPTGCGGSTCMYPSGGRQQGGYNNRFNPQRFNTYLQNNLGSHGEVEVFSAVESRCPGAPYGANQCASIGVAPCGGTRRCRAGAQCCPSGCTGVNVCLRTSPGNVELP